MRDREEDEKKSRRRASERKSTRARETEAHCDGGYGEGKRGPKGENAKARYRVEKCEPSTRPTNVDEPKSRTVKERTAKMRARRTERESEKEREKERETRPIATSANFSAKARFAEEQAQREIARLSSGRRWRVFFSRLLSFSLRTTRRTIEYER